MKKKLAILSTIMAAVFSCHLTAYCESLPLGVTRGAEDTYKISAMTKFYCGQYAEAVKDYDKAIEANPHEALYYYKRGLAKYHLKQYAGAVNDFDCAIRLDPKNALYYNDRGASKGDLGQYEAAIKDYDKAIALERNVAAYYGNRGNAKYYLCDFSAAIKDFDQAIAIAPDYPPYYNNRGEAYRNLKLATEAVQDFDKAIRLEPNIGFYYHNRGQARLMLKRFDDALADANKAIDLDRNDFKHYIGRALIYMECNKLNLAIQDCQKALTLNSGHIAAHYVFAICSFKNKDYDNGFTALSKAIDIVNQNTKLVPKEFYDYVMKFRDSTKIFLEQKEFLDLYEDGKYSGVSEEAYETAKNKMTQSKAEFEANVEKSSELISLIIDRPISIGGDFGSNGPNVLK